MKQTTEHVTEMKPEVVTQLADLSDVDKVLTRMNVNRFKTTLLIGLGFIVLMINEFVTKRRVSQLALYAVLSLFMFVTSAGIWHRRKQK